MGRKQKSISFPAEVYEEAVQLYEKHKEGFNALGIRSVPEMIKVMANLGKKPLLEFLEGKRALSELLVEVGKSRSHSTENVSEQE